MGGHQHFGEFLTLDHALEEWRRCLDRYVGQYGLYLAYGIIAYHGEDKKYRLAMRFSK